MAVKPPEEVIILAVNVAYGRKGSQERGREEKDWGENTHHRF
jgi:hypothetical protein